ncbi:MAG: 50S ribosomal protein L3 [Chloroflexota bacterium]
MIQGIIGRKLGMTQVFRSNGDVAAVTAIEAGPCAVIQVKTAAKDGYDAVQLGFGKAKRLSSPEKGHLGKSGEFRHLREIRVAGEETASLGTKVDVSIFKAGDRVDIVGATKGKGFAGVVKRYHFAGGPKTRGQSDRTRAPGTIGNLPGHVSPGMRMAGHMGTGQATAQNIEVVSSDPERNLLLLKGAVPGATNGIVVIKKSGKGK